MKYRALFFDLDGTLSDPREGILNSIQYAAEYYGVHTDRQDLYKYIGPPLKNTFTELIGEDEAMDAVLKYRERFDAGGGLFENEMYDGIPEMLSRLKDMGYIMCTASSKPQTFVERILEHFDILKYFDYVGGASLDEKRSEKDRVIQYVLDMAGLENSEVLMIGDRKYDLEGAMLMGMDAVGVLYGFGDREELSEYPSIALIETPGELVDLLRAGDYDAAQ